MTDLKEIQEIARGYKKPAIGCVGSHSALNICEGAVSEGFETYVFCERGRGAPYSKYFKSLWLNGKRVRGVVDHPIVCYKFKEVLSTYWQSFLRRNSIIWIPNRSFWVYCGKKEIQEKFRVPIFGSRNVLHLEDREKEEFNYYDVLMKAGIRTPEKYASPEDIDRLGPAMVKIPHAVRPLERAFFLAPTTEKYYEGVESRIAQGIISREDVSHQRIERFAFGPVCNVNFFYSPITKELGRAEPLELMSTEWRFESSLDGLTRLTAKEQLDLPKKYSEPTYIVVGHAAMTVRESILEQIFEMGEKFVKTMGELYPPGIIGPFGLQCIIEEIEGKPIFCCYDVAFRIPGGDNITTFSGHPYLNTLWHQRMSTGRRIAYEIRRAIQYGLLDKIVT